MSVSLSLVLSSLVNSTEQHVVLAVTFCALDTFFLKILVHKLWLSEATSTIQLEISHSTT